MLALAAPLAGAWPGVACRIRSGADVAAPLERGPITYFNRACASCHGDYGSFYGDGFAMGLPDADLQRTVREMVAGPARDRLPTPDLDALTAYHRSLADGTPFLAWTAGPDQAAITGEVTPGSSVTVAFGGQTVAAQVKGHAWRAAVPAGTAAWSEIRAERAGRVTVLRPSSAHSHRPEALPTSPPGR